ncbi:EamA family transporter RarD [Novosphingobium sp. ZN18A2]|uniref:EamA family transporter RarD n=1 Tax=Novosphingobium sp. ZN18A2 TaxID=3079861 RepID=UPI0030CC54C2
MQAHPERAANGLPLALAAYTIWGFLPLYYHLLRGIAPLELVGWRVIFTLPICLAIIVFRKQGAQLRMALTTPRILIALAASALLIGGNWLIYVIAITSDRVLAASLGYYINPLVSVLLGTFLLGERLSRTQWLAVGIAGAGIALLIGGALDMLGIALSLALCFGGYGLIRKLAPIGAVPGLTVEATILLLPAVAIVAWSGQGPAGSALAISTSTSALIALSGVLTAVPLLLFAVAVRRMNLSTIGFLQFLTPTLAFLIGHFVFGEPLSPTRLACFVLIWIAITLFVRDILAKRKETAPNPRGT